MNMEKIWKIHRKKQILPCKNSPTQTHSFYRLDKEVTKILKLPKWQCRYCLQKITSM